MKNWKLIGAAAGVLFGISVLIYLDPAIHHWLSAHHRDGLDAAAWASWMQAVGSIGAIYATGWFFRKERELERQAEVDARSRDHYRWQITVASVFMPAHMTALDCIRRRRAGETAEQIADQLQRLDDLRALLFSFLDRDTEAMVLQSVISTTGVLSNIISELRRDVTPGYFENLERLNKQMLDQATNMSGMSSAARQELQNRGWGY